MFKQQGNRMYRFIALAGLVSLSACMTIDADALGARIAAVDLPTETDRAIDDSFRSQPFEGGRVYVVANEHGDLHIFSLTPCRGGTHICG